MGCIYKLTFKSGKSYIGQTVRSITTRMTAHKATMTAGSMLAVYCAWRSHGAPDVEILARSNDPEELHALECAAIAAHGTLAPNGYNITMGGDTAPSKAPEVAAKIAAKARGRIVPEEKRQQIAEAMRKRWEDPEYRALVSARVSASNTEEVSEKRSESAKKRWERQKASGWVMSEETRQKLRVKPVSKEARAKMSESAKGKVITEETRARMSAANSGRKYGAYSEERKQKAADGIRAAWQDPEKRARLMAARKAAWETRRANKESK